MSNIRLGFIALDCADPGRLSAFWAELLGGEVTFSNDDFAAVKTDRLWLAATRVDDFLPPTWPDGPVPKQLHLDLAVDDLDAAERTALWYALASNRQPTGTRRQGGAERRFRAGNGCRFGEAP